MATPKVGITTPSLRSRKKREVLENVLIAHRLDDNIRVLYDSGFPTVEIFFKWYTFAESIAVKAGP